MGLDDNRTDAVSELNRLFEELGGLRMPKLRRLLDGKALEVFGDTDTDLWEEDAFLTEDIFDFLDKGTIGVKIMKYDLNIDGRLAATRQHVSNREMLAEFDELIVFRQNTRRLMEALSKASGVPIRFVNIQEQAESQGKE